MTGARTERAKASAVWTRYAPEAPSFLGILVTTRLALPLLRLLRWRLPTSLPETGHDLGARVLPGALGLERGRRLLALDKGVVGRRAIRGNLAGIQAGARGDDVPGGGQVLLRAAAEGERADRRGADTRHLATDHLRVAGAHNGLVHGREIVAGASVFAGGHQGERAIVIEGGELHLPRHGGLTVDHLELLVGEQRLARDVPRVARPHARRSRRQAHPGRGAVVRDGLDPIERVARDRDDRSGRRRGVGGSHRRRGAIDARLGGLCSGRRIGALVATAHGEDGCGDQHRCRFHRDLPWIRAAERGAWPGVAVGAARREAVKGEPPEKHHRAQPRPGISRFRQGASPAQGLQSHGSRRTQSPPRRLAAELVHALDHEPALATSYTEIQKLFASRADAVAEGMARAKNEAAAADKPQPQQPRAPGSVSAASRRLRAAPSSEYHPAARQTRSPRAAPPLRSPRSRTAPTSTRFAPAAAASSSA